MKFDTITVPEVKIIKATDDNGYVLILYIDGKLSGCYNSPDEIHYQVHKLLVNVLGGV